jgi:hypothetical protein
MEEFEERDQEFEMHLEKCEAARAPLATSR